MRYMAIIATLAALVFGPARAGPTVKVAEYLFHLDGYEWLADGALFCLDGKCADGEALYLVADPQGAAIGVHVVIQGLGPNDTDGTVTEGCRVLSRFLDGKLYGTPGALVYATEFPAADNVENSVLFAVAFTDLTDAAGAQIPFWPLDSSSVRDVRQRRLVRKFESGDFTVLDDPAWPAAWAALVAKAAEDLAALSTDARYSRLTLQRTTSPAERDTALARLVDLINDPARERPVTGEDCLPEGILSLAED